MDMNTHIAQEEATETTETSTVTHMAQVLTSLILNLGNARNYDSYSSARTQQNNDYYTANQGNYLAPQQTSQNNYYSSTQQAIPVTVEHQTAKYVVEEE